MEIDIEKKKKNDREYRRYYGDIAKKIGQPTPRTDQTYAMGDCVMVMTKYIHETKTKIWKLGYVTGVSRHLYDPCIGYDACGDGNGEGEMIARFNPRVYSKEAGTYFYDIVYHDDDKGMCVVYENAREQDLRLPTKEEIDAAVAAEKKALSAM
jgi:hypothetical protein